MTREPSSPGEVGPGRAIVLAEGSLVVLVGPSGAGKSTFARRHFRPTEVLSSDAFRAMIADDENDQAATPDAFTLLGFALDRRLKRRRLTVVDATNLKAEDRLSLVSIARARRAPMAAIVFDLPEPVLEMRRVSRTDRRLPRPALDRHLRLVSGVEAELRAEGFDPIVRLASAADVDLAHVERTRGPGPRGDRGPRRHDAAAPLPGGDAAIDRRDDGSRFDLIGDVHGCADELVELLGMLGYRVEEQGREVRVTASHDRKVVLLGDLVDRGPATPRVLRVAMALAESGRGLALLGNHDWKLLRAMWGRNVRVSHGLAESLAQLNDEPEAFRHCVQSYLESLPSQLLLDGGRLVAAHAGVTETLQGQTSERARQFALYGETTGEHDEFGLPVRINWSRHYRGAAAVVYGHTPVLEPQWLNNTIDIDTGCVFGGRLTALRWPEREIVSVPAARVYYESARPLLEGIDNREFLGGRPEE